MLITKLNRFSRLFWPPDEPDEWKFMVDDSYLYSIIEKIWTQTAGGLIY